MLPDLFQVYFPVSGVRTSLLLPPVVAFVVSFFTSMGGVSGAFLLLPFQMSVLHYTSPSVSATNFLFNIVAIPSGVYRYIKEGRMAWPLTIVVILGTLPGVFVGYYLRVLFLPDPRVFKLFVGCVLLYVGVRLLLDAVRKGRGKPNPTLRGQGDSVVRTISLSIKQCSYSFRGETHSFNTLWMFLLALVVGVIGGAYGIGGGSIIAPFCITIFALPVYTVAGAALMGTFITSIAGILFYTLMPSPLPVNTSPDWCLGLLFGIGGFAGMYLGARFQKHVPQRIIKVLLGLIILSVSGRYILQFLR